LTENDGKQSTATIIIRLLVVFASIFALGAIAYALPRLGSRLALPILPSGIAVAAAFRWGRRMWLAIFAAGLAIELFLHEALVDAVGVGVGLAAGACLSAWLLERSGFNSSFARAKDVPLFILAAAAGMALAPTFGFLGIYFAGAGASALDLNRWLSWWSNTTTGVLLLGSVLVAYSRQSFVRLRGHWLEGAVWLLGLVFCCGWIILGQGATGRPLISVLAIILIVVSAIRFGLVAATAGSIAITTTTAFSLAFGVGQFAQFDALQAHIIIWSFIAALSGLSLIITALLAERDAASLAKLHAEQRYAQVFNGSPQPLWVHARDTLTFLLVNEAALRQYGWTREELLSRTIEVLAPAANRPVLPPPGESGEPDTAAEPFETQHATKEGRLLEVEVWTRSIDIGGQAAELVYAIDVTERRAFGQALMDAISGEQRRIAEELHDGLGQELTGLALSVRALANRTHKEREAISVDLDQLALLATSCIQDAHRMVQGLSPLTNADGNLNAALGGLARRSSLSGTRVQFRNEHGVPALVDLKVRNHLYRIAQEAVQNALKHSRASSIDIELSARPGSLMLSITDDGQGLDAQAASGMGLGMRTMRFRASAIGGKLSIRRGAGGGNSVVCHVPANTALAETI
jgi:PAS domain S-box-containing protein